MTARGPATTVADLQWVAVSAEHPCPVCAASSECATAPFQGGVAVDCRNIVSAWPMTDGGWLHRLPPDGAADDAEDCADGAACVFPVPCRPGDCGRTPLTPAGGRVWP